MRKKPCFAGNAPKGWEKKTVFECDGQKWAIYENTENESGWTGIKIVLLFEKARKANYWLSYSKKEGRFAFRGDAFAIIKNNKKLLQAACRSVGIDPSKTIETFDPKYATRENDDEI